MRGIEHLCYCAPECAHIFLISAVDLRWFKLCSLCLLDSQFGCIVAAALVICCQPSELVVILSSH